MPLPLASCADDVPDDVCCASIFDVADRIRTIANDAVGSCFGDECADRPWRSYVSIGPSIPEPLGDALVVHMTEIGASPNSRTGQGRLLPAGVQRGQFTVMMTENGWPQIQVDEFGEVISVPDSEMVNAIARHAYSHGERMYRALLNAGQRNQSHADALFPISTFGTYVSSFEIGSLRPIQPAAFTVGWTVPLTVVMTFPPLTA